jgi:hypothetical protein
VHEHRERGERTDKLSTRREGFPAALAWRLAADRMSHSRLAFGGSRRDLSGPAAPGRRRERRPFPEPASHPPWPRSCVRRDHDWRLPDPRHGVHVLTADDVLRMLKEGRSLREIERRAASEAARIAVEHALNEEGWSRRRAARRLQISYTAFTYKATRALGDGAAGGPIECRGDSIAGAERSLSTGPKSPPRYPPDFRRYIVELVRSGRTPEELSRQFAPSAQAIRNWVWQADRDPRRREGGLTAAEQVELQLDGVRDRDAV